jgi:hypothetical protein
VKEAEPHQAELRRQLTEVQALLKQMADSGKEGTERYAKAKEIEKEVAGLLEQHRLELLELGAAARLLAGGELRQVLPLDDAKLLDTAKPRLRNGQVVPNHAAKAARQGGMVRALLKAGPVAVAVLGGSHDLTDALNPRGRQGSNTCACLCGRTRIWRGEPGRAILENLRRWGGPQRATGQRLRADVKVTDTRKPRPSNWAVHWPSSRFRLPIHRLPALPEARLRPSPARAGGRVAFQ